MFINHELAEQIIAKSSAILERSIIVCDTNGVILAGPGRAGQFVPEALRASQTGSPLNGSLDDHDIRWCPFVYEYQTTGVFGIIQTDTPVTPEAVNLVQGLAEVIVHQYFVLDKLQSTDVVKANFIKQILQSGGAKPEEVYQQADILKLNLRFPQAVILIHIDEFEESLGKTTTELEANASRLAIIRETERVATLFKEAFQNYQDNIVVYGGENTFILLKGIGGENLNTLNTIRFLKEKADYLYDTLSKLHKNKLITIGVGQYYADLGGLRKSYQDAKLSLNIGVKVWGKGRVYHIKDVGMFITLANVQHERKAELAYQILSPLLRNQQLFKTVQLFLANNLNLTEAAQKLHIHRNTLIYRLDKTKKLINLDPRQFEDALQIKLGLMFYQPT
jgi:sugar diacid utilization regulator